MEADFEILNQGHMREEIEVALLTLNGNKYVGTITPQEALLQPQSIECNSRKYSDKSQTSNSKNWELIKKIKLPSMSMLADYKLLFLKCIFCTLE